MDKIKAFFLTSVLGGVTVILPTVILISVFSWLFNFVRKLIAPITNLLVSKSEIHSLLADVIVIIIIIGVCFAVGILVKTRFGKFLHRLVEEKLLKVAPGYTLIKETVLQIIGNKKSPFSSVALVQIFGNETMVTAFVTDEHEDGRFSVFVPTGPNPTSGNIYHLKSEYVHPVSVSVEDAMRSIISCGAGSSTLVAKYKGKNA